MIENLGSMKPATILTVDGKHNLSFCLFLFPRMQEHQLLIHSWLTKKTRKVLRIMSRCHQGYDYYQAIPKCMITGEPVLKSRFVFGFVRNPWSRLVTLYRNRKEFHKCSNFKDFVDLYQKASDFQVAPGHYKNQIDWFKCRDTGAIAADFIGKYENLDHDFEFALSQVGLRIKDPIPHLCGDNPKRQHSKVKAKAGEGGSIPLPAVDYRNFYNSSTKDIVYRKCKEDIEYFGYEF